MNYDYIGHLETLRTDLKEILPHIDAVRFIKKFPANKLRHTGDNRYAHMYRGVSYSVLKPVFDKYQADADMFGYNFEQYMPTDKNMLLHKGTDR